jgi:hypothetical protein
MTAAQAKEQASSINSSKIFGMINDSVSKGQFEMNILASSISDDDIIKLKELGYRILKYKIHGFIDMISISWG